jgi:hypothetical protein
MTVQYGTSKKGYILKQGKKAHWLLATQLYTEFTEDLGGRGEKIGERDIRELKGLANGLYRITASMWSTKDFRWLWSIDTIKPITTKAEIERLEAICATPLKLWTTPMPGISGQLKKEYFAAGGSRSKRKQTERLLYYLKKMTAGGV